jgi:hypothetical protein
VSFWIIRWNPEGFPEVVIPHSTGAPQFTADQKDSKKSKKFYFKFADLIRYEESDIIQKYSDLTNFNPNTDNGSDQGFLDDLQKGNLQIRRKNARTSYEWMTKYSGELPTGGSSTVDQLKKYSGNIKWENGKDRYNSPDLFIVDPESACHLLDLEEEFYMRFGKKLAFTIDEAAATFTDKISLSKKTNEMGNRLAYLMNNPPSYLVLASASLSRKLVEGIDSLKSYKVQTVQETNRTNSFVFLHLNEDGSIVTPLNGLDAKTMKESISRWGPNVYRCFPPVVVDKILSEFSDEFSGFSRPQFEDVLGMSEFMNFISRFLNKIADMEEDARGRIINYKPNLNKVDNHPIGLTFVSCEMDKWILKYLGNTKVTRDKIRQKEESVLYSMKAKLGLLEQKLKSAKTKDGRDEVFTNAGDSSDSIKKEIGEKFG